MGPDAVARRARTAGGTLELSAADDDRCLAPWSRAGRRLCGGAEFSHFPRIVVTQVEGTSSNYFEMLVCRTCRKTDMFVDLHQIERLNAHTILRPTVSPPYR